MKLHNLEALVQQQFFGIFMKCSKSSCGFFSHVAHHRLAWLLVIGLLGIFADQASKIWAQQTLAEPYEVNEEIIIDGVAENITKKIYYPLRSIEVVPNFFNLIYKENPAAAFSLTSSIPPSIRRPMLVGVSLIASIFFLFWYFRMRSQDGLLLASFSFILTGAIGNLIDRIRLGYVIDFLDVHAGIFGYENAHWPTFNVADSLIVIGAIGVIFRTIWPMPSENQN